MRRSDIEGILDQLVALWPLMADNYLRTKNKTTCVLACRVATDVLRPMGLRAKPVTVGVRAMNDAYARAIEEDRPPSAEEGAWTVDIGIGPPAEGDGLDAHVVLLVQDRYLLDLTIDQADRPQKGIHTAPYWLELTGDMKADFMGRGLHLEREGTHLVYVRSPKLHGRVMRSPDWTLRNKSQGSVAVATIRDTTDRILYELRRGAKIRNRE